MKPLIISCLGAGLALTCTLPAAAAGRVWLLPHTLDVRAVADSDFAKKKDEYMHDANREMQEWNDKLHRAGNHAEQDIDQAWTNTKDAARRLEVAGADQWDRAKHGFESAMQGLKDRWHKIHPEDE